MLTCILLLTACSIPLAVSIETDCAWAQQIKAEADTKNWLKSLYNSETQEPLNLQHIKEDGTVVDRTVPNSFSLFLQRVQRNNIKQAEFC